MATQAPTLVRHPEVRTAQQVTELKHQWSAYQRSNALKTTAQRELIVDVFLTGNSTDSHVSIDELLASVRRRNPRVGYATVYRTVKHLLDAGAGRMFKRCFGAMAREVSA